MIADYLDEILKRNRRVVAEYDNGLYVTTERSPDVKKLVAALRVVAAFFAVEYEESTVPGGCMHIPSQKFHAVVPKIAAILRGKETA